MAEITSYQIARMASMLGLTPDKSEWPMMTIIKLINLERDEGYLALHKEISAMMTPPEHNQSFVIENNCKGAKVTIFPCSGVSGKLTILIEDK